MNEQQITSLDEVGRLNAAETALWVTSAVRDRAADRFSFSILPALQTLPAQVATLVVIGGGTLLDEAKVWRLEQRPDLKLIAIPSVWGSGAEASPIAVRNRNGKKEIRVDLRLRPDARAVWPELGASMSREQAEFGCGDCWAHALEGFLSPLASPELRKESAALLNRMLITPVANYAAWFELSAAACAVQARSSVGLVHGIAHTLEGVLIADGAPEAWSHARLCSLYLWPVMTFNVQTSGKPRQLLEAFGVAGDAVFAMLRSLFHRAAYDATLPALKQHWITVLRDPCTRTNCALARPASLDFFLQWEGP